MTGDTIAGLIDAEANFQISEMNGGRTMSCGLRLDVRDDDAELLHAVVSATGTGVVVRKDKRGNPQASWTVYRKDHLARLVTMFDAHPLRSRKRGEFDVWREAVLA